MSSTVSLLGAGLLGLLFAGYIGQKYLPAPVPRIVGIDLGTTYSSIGVYHSGSGDTEIIPVGQRGARSIPSVVCFLPNGTLLVGHEALAQAEHHPMGTVYDSKRFIGTQLTRAEFDVESARYPFEMELSETGFVTFLVPQSKDSRRIVTPEEVGAIIMDYLRLHAEKTLNAKIKRAVISVPAEFSEARRNATIRSADLAGMEVLRVISEPTAAALAYGLHKKEDVDYVLIVDLGGGTLDVSLLFVQGGMFMTTSMAGNNHLGGQDFNQKTYEIIKSEIESKYHERLTHPEDAQALRLAIETAKLGLTLNHEWTLSISLTNFSHSSSNSVVDSHIDMSGVVVFSRKISRLEFEQWNRELFKKVLRPIDAALADAQLTPADVSEIVLVGGSTRIPKIRQIIHDFFQKTINVGVDPELAVVTGVAVQAGVMGGGWPLQVSATELPTKLRKIHVYD